MVVAAAVPAALLQCKSHGKPRSSLSLLSTEPSWCLVTSSKRNKVSVYRRHPAASPADCRSLVFSMQSMHSGRDQKKRAVRERCFEIFGG